ncbi:MAG TPA: NfeD family protein [Tepidisphaeraceae bacterium]|jgi:membrane-bound serine protease (ClpP class)
MTLLVTWLIILIVAAVIVFVAEIFVPSAGILSIIGGVLLVAAIGVAFAVNRWAGVGLTAAVVAVTPFAFAAGVSLWTRTPIGRQMTLTATSGTAATIDVLVGETAVAVTDLRPMGECETATARVECQAEMGQIIPAGTRVKILAIDAGVATVRPASGGG